MHQIIIKFNIAKNNEICKANKSFSLLTIFTVEMPTETGWLKPTSMERKNLDQ